MRLVLQRVSEASVKVNDEIVGEIGRGLVVLLGVAPDDGPDQVDWLVDKTLGLRIFSGPGANGLDKPMNASVLDVGGEVLVVSQFTLTADVSRGKRPSFTTAAKPEHAETIYQTYVAAMSERITTATGIFGADMQVALVNDGPVTFVLER